jgi:predicted alpha/beta hydrolase
METFTILSGGDFPLSVNRFDATAPNGKIILICAATGVKQRFYQSFAGGLAEEGYTVYTFDYRGIGKSRPRILRGFKASMRDWARKDLEAVTACLEARHPGAKKILVGHSIGGIFVGLTPACQAYAAFITIASQFGYWKYFSNKRKPMVLWTFFVAVPLLSRLLGYFPSRIKQLGEPLPAGVALDWKTLITNTGSVLALAGDKDNHYPEIRQPMLMLSVEDDWMAPKAAVDKLATAVFANAKVERRHILCAEANGNSIGHMNFFRKTFRDTLWPITFNWLKAI